MVGDTVANFPVNSIAAGYIPRVGNDPKRVQARVTEVNSNTQQVKIAGIWIPVERVWKPVTTTLITNGPSDTTIHMNYGRDLWGIMLRGVWGVHQGGYGGHRWTQLGKLVVCMWLDDTNTSAVTTCEEDRPAYLRIHVENIALR